MLRAGVHIFVGLEVLHETFQPKDAAYREKHAALLRGMRGNGVPLAAELLHASAAGLDCSYAIDAATKVAQEAIVDLKIDCAALSEFQATKDQGRASLLNVDRVARERYLGLGIAQDATFKEAVSAAGLDRQFLRSSHGVLLRGQSTQRASGRMWLVDPSARCWALGWIWRSRVGSLSSANRAPGHDDLAQLVVLPHCDAFVTDDKRLAKVAREVCEVGRLGRPWDRWRRPAPWIGGFEAFADLLLRSKE